MHETLILGLDPGVRHTGWAVLDAAYVLKAAGTWRPERCLRGRARDLWLKERLLRLVQSWQPTHVVFEEFVWRDDTKNGHKFVEGRADMERLLGGIQMLGLLPPEPQVTAALPQTWGLEFCGQTRHEKEDIARIVNYRLHMDLQGDTEDNHMCDAIGL